MGFMYIKWKRCLTTWDISAAEKIAAFEKVGVRVAKHPGEIAELVAKLA